MRGFVIVLVLLVAVGIVTYLAAFVVNEGNQVFVTQFGKPVGEPITEAGLHFKIPFMQKARFFEKRFLEWDGNPNQVPTRDKLYISIDTYARWRIKDPLVFFQKVTNEFGARSRLDDILDGATRNAVAKNDLVELVRSKERAVFLDEDPDEAGVSDKLPEFEYGRSAITAEILRYAGPDLETLGIELLDIRFKRINYETSVQRKIFERMISERIRIAEKFRSEGQGDASRILGQRERDLKTIQSEAYRTVQEIKGRADAEATAIYASAFDQSEESRNFYKFLKTMEAYTRTLSERDWLILSTETEFFQYLHTSDPYR